MDKVVIDSSVWIDYFNKKTSLNIEWITNSILNQNVQTSICVLPIILQEVLQGVKDKSTFEFVRENMQGFNFIDYNAYEVAVDAARLFFDLKKTGITIRKSNDVLIASICITKGLHILHNDKDFDNIAKHTSLKIFKP